MCCIPDMCHTCPSVANSELCEPEKKNYPVLRTLVPRPTSHRKWVGEPDYTAPSLATFRDTCLFSLFLPLAFQHLLSHLSTLPLSLATFLATFLATCLFSRRSFCLLSFCLTYPHSSIPHICHFFSTGTIFGSIFLHAKTRKSYQNRFRDKTAQIAKK